MYRDIFGCYPDNTIKKYADVAILKKNSNPSSYNEQCRYIRGLAVEYPLEFLSQEDLKKAKSFQFGLIIVPNYVFT